MGILWTTYPLTDEMKEWLDSEGVEYPNTPSRFPTGSEIRNALKQLQGLNVEITDNGIGGPWQAWIESKSEPEEFWTLLNISVYSGDDEPQEIWFEKGNESTIKSVLQSICSNCGPLVLIADVGGEPEVIYA